MKKENLLSAISDLYKIKESGFCEGSEVCNDESICDWCIADETISSISNIVELAMEDLQGEEE